MSKIFVWIGLDWTGFAAVAPFGFRENGGKSKKTTSVNNSIKFSTINQIANVT